MLQRISQWLLYPPPAGSMGILLQQSLVRTRLSSWTKTHKSMRESMTISSHGVFNSHTCARGASSSSSIAAQVNTSAPISYGSLSSPVHVSSLGNSSLHCDLISLVDLGRDVHFLAVQFFTFKTE